MDQSQAFQSKLVQRREHFNRKLRLRRILSGSIVSSDGGLPFETNGYVKMGYLRYRYSGHWTGLRQIYSTDSGCSVGGYSSSVDSECEELFVDPVKKVEPREIVRCEKCNRPKRVKQKRDASTQSDETITKESSSLETQHIHSMTLYKPLPDVLSPPSLDSIVQCRVVRDRSSIISTFYPTYYLFYERNDHPRIPSLVARKRKKCSTSRYLISTQNENLRRRNSSLVGELRSNLVGTKFYLKSDRSDEGKTVEIDSCLIFYDSNILGMEGPRRMKVLVPLSRDAGKQMSLHEKGRHQSNGSVLQLVNKEPKWDKETQSYVLYFNGRVTKSSVKNFQLYQPPFDSVLLQFGKIDKDEFTLDYQHPLNAVQAFAIALSSFDHKISCE